MDIQEMEEKFRKEVMAAGSLIYSKQLLENFISYWSEPDRARKPKLRYQKQKTWETKRRLATWAKHNYDGIQCFLTESERTIAQKKHAFAISLEPFLAKYGRETLNAFYAHYTTPENKPEPKILRWESFEFFDLATRLEQWKQRESKVQFNTSQYRNY